MQIAAREDLLPRGAGRMTARHEIDLGNVTLYWHFTLATALITVTVIAGFRWWPDRS
jgi:cytochrome c oxidase subunit I+III